MEQQLKVNTTAKEVLYNVYDQGFPYLLIVQHYLMMAFTIIFPVLLL